MKTILILLIMAGSVSVFCGCQSVHKQGDETSTPEVRKTGPLAFGWPFLEPEMMISRGGTTRGSEVALATEPDPRWMDLQEPGLNHFERDRRAILAMAGNFRTSFQFTETAGFTGDYAPPRPYFSWGTEQVAVIEDTGEFISLQHTLVMYFQDESGEVTGPMVMKHWRQDWTYQDTDLHTYRGDRTWARQPLPEKAVKGAWSQAVFQVDDSPRYEVLGRWAHGKNYSSWTSRTSRRPLPRREYSVRSDYNVLRGEHKITIVPTGWLHEQHNRKSLRANQSETYIAQEVGLNRYERIDKPDLSAAETSWTKTEPYWRAVRLAWNAVLAKHDRFQLKSEYQDMELYQLHFSHAGEIEQLDNYDAEEWGRRAKDTIELFLIIPSDP